MPTLSLCMIVKNEDNFLEQCINSVKDLVDEIIIVDTGSTDRTKEIAARFTNKVYDFKWCDDFSAARNESLKYATGDWILVLDADEIIAKEDHEKISKLINNYEIMGFSLIQRNYTNDSSVLGFVPSQSNNHANKLLGWFDSWIIRLFRNNFNIKFEGEIHERVDNSIEKLDGKWVLAPLVIHHYVESKGSKIRSEKLHFYQQLAEKKVQNDPSNAVAHYQLGVIYKEQGSFSLAENELRKAVELDKKLVIPQLDLALMQQKQNKFDEAITNYIKALEKNNQLAEAYFGLGFCYFKRNDLTDSIINFKKAIQFNPYFVEAYINLGAAYEKQGNFVVAVKALAKAVSLSPFSARAYYNLGVVCEKALNWPKALECYTKAIELNYIRKEELKKRVAKINGLLNGKTH